MHGPSRQIAVVDEDETLRESICRAIRLESHRAIGFADGHAAWESFARAVPDCVVVSMGISGVDGPELCQRLRGRSATLPIIAVTARDEDLDRALSPDLAVDDCLEKPFSIKDLVPRLKALIRRAGLRGGEPLAWEDRPVTLGALTVDPLRLSAHWNSTDLHLTVTEFFLLHALVRRAGIVKTRDQLLQETFPGRTSAADGIIDRTITRLQGRFERLDPAFDSLEGVHGAGYRYRAARRA